MKTKLSFKRFTLLLTVLFCMSIGFITGQKINASECENPEASDSGCTNDAYMGAKWNVKPVRVYLGEADNTNVKARMRNAITHFNNNQTYIDFYEAAPVVERGYIKVIDNNYQFENWTALADGSWHGGWPIDTSYDVHRPITIKFNLRTFPGTVNQENGTARHELGHSIGMGHRSSSATLMYCSRSRTALGLTASDKSILDVIY